MISLQIFCDGISRVQECQDVRHEALGTLVVSDSLKGTYPYEWRDDRKSAPGCSGRVANVIRNTQVPRVNPDAGTKQLQSSGSPRGSSD